MFLKEKFLILRKAVLKRIFDSLATGLSGHD
jgi:hypothetical protein